MFDTKESLKIQYSTEISDVEIEYLCKRMETKYVEEFQECPFPTHTDNLYVCVMDYGSYLSLINELSVFENVEI